MNAHAAALALASPGCGTAPPNGPPVDAATDDAAAGATFILFTGQAAVASPIESHAAAVTLGDALAAQLVAANP